MKRRATTIVILLIIGFFTQRPVIAQTAEKIIEKHIEALGGQENLDAVKSMKITGFFTSFSERKPMTEYKTTDNIYYCELFWGQHPVVEARDGDLCWTINMWYDIPFPRRCNDNEAKIIEQKNDLFTPFVHYAEKGYTVEYMGLEEMDGIRVHKLQLTRPGHQAETWYLDATTYLPYFCISMWGDFGYPTPQECYFDDWRRVGKVMIPFTVDRVFSIRNRVVEIEKVECNVPVGKDMVAMPMSKEMKMLKPFEGEWSVILETQGRGGAFVRSDSTTSVIKFIGDKNLLEESISYKNDFPIHKISQWSFNRKLNTYILTVFNDFDSNVEVLQGGFQDDILSFDNAEIHFSNDRKADQTFRKQIFSEISKDGFLVEMAISTDGENWSVQERFIYSALRK